VENIPGHRDHRSDDHDQLIVIIPERVIGIIPEPVIGMPRNTDRPRPESPLRPTFGRGLHLDLVSRQL
jgi:hypothetical protein